MQVLQLAASCNTHLIIAKAGAEQKVIACSLKALFMAKTCNM